MAKFKLNDETKVQVDATTNRGRSAKRFENCKTFADVYGQKTKSETVRAYRYSLGWQIEVRTITPSGYMKRVACFPIVDDNGERIR